MIKKELISIIEKKDTNVILFSFLLKRIRDVNNGRDIFNQLWNLLEMNSSFFSVKLSKSETHLYLGYYIDSNLNLSLEINKIISNLVNTVFSIIPDYITVQPIKNERFNINLSQTNRSLRGQSNRNLKFKYISITNLLMNKSITAILRDLKGIRGLNIALGVEIIDEKGEYSLIMELSSNSENEMVKIERNLLEYLTSNNFINGTIKMIPDKIIRKRPIQTYLGICNHKLEEKNMIAILHSIVHLIDIDANEDCKTIVPRQWLGFIHKAIPNQEIPNKDILKEVPITTGNELISIDDMEKKPSRSSLLTQEELEDKLFSYLNDVEFTQIPSCDESKNLVCLLINSIHFEFLFVPDYNLISPELISRDVDYLKEEKLFFIITGDPILEENNNLDHIIYINNFEKKMLLR